MPQVEYYTDEDSTRCARTDRGEVSALGPAITAPDLRRCEAALGCAIPREYAAWLLEINGGIPKWGPWESAFFTWEVDGKARGDSVDFLCGIDHPVPGMDLVGQNSAYQSKVPPGTLVIGGANFESDDRRFLIKLEGEAAGSVLDWWIDRKRKKPVVHTLAPNFTAFWNSLLTDMPETLP